MRPALLVGRERERAVLLRAISEVAAGRGQAIGFTGAPGIGKTTLLHEAVASASDRGIACAWGVAWDGTGAPVFWPLLQALRGLASRVPSQASHALLDAASFLSSNPSIDEHDPADARAAIFERTVSALAALAQPALIAMDDLHAADTATLEILSFCLRATRGLPLLWVLAWRDSEMGDRPESIFRALASLRREVHALAPRPLATNDISELARAETGTMLDPHELELLETRTLGNPLFVIELLRQGGEEALPETVRQAWSSRIARLDADARAVIEAAAVLGDELRLPALSAIFELTPEATLGHMAPLIKERILVDEGGTRFRFSHPLVREAVIALLEPARRIALHARAGRALSSLRREGMQIPSSAIAHHFLAAGPAIDPATAFAATKEAAEAAARVGADDDAAAIFDRAVTMLDDVDAPTAVRLEALILRTEALVRAGRRTEGIACADRALELARTSGNADALARAALARGLEIQAGVIDPLLVRALEEAEEVLQKEPSVLRARVMARLAAARQPAPNPKEPIEMARQAIAMADAVSAPPQDLAVVLFNASATMVDLTDARLRAPIDQRTFAVALEAGERAFAIRAAARLVIDQLEMGDLAQAERWTSELGRLVGEVESSRWRWLPLAMEASVRHAKGDIRGALASNGLLMRVASELEDPIAIRSAFIQRTGLLRDGGTREDLQEQAHAMWNASASLQNKRMKHIATAATFASLSDREATLTYLAGVPFDPVWDHYPAPISMWTEIASALEDHALVKRVLEAAEQCERRWITWGFIGLFFDGPTDRARGKLLLFLGRAEEAEAVLERTAEDCRARGMKTAWARTLYERARALIALGRIDGARAVLDRLEPEASQMPLLLESIRATRSSLTDTEQLSLSMEGDLWRLLYRGRAHHLKSQKGFAMLVRLLDRPDDELHALDLMGVEEAIDAGDSGEVLDEAAKKSYRRRLTSIEDELREAEERGDVDRKEELLSEKDALARELTRGFGLSGRARRSGAAAERARVNVQRRVKDAIKKIGEVEPELGEHLEVAVSTGLFCSYRPRAKKR